MKQVYKTTHPTGKIYIGKDNYESSRYFGNPSIELINADFAHLPDEIRLDYTARKKFFGNPNPRLMLSYLKKR